MAERNRVIQHAMGGGGGGSESESEEGHVSSANALPCSHPTCHSSSLLSFKCDACVRAFCLAHRLPHAHQCPNMAAANHTIFLCPLCKGSVDVVPGESIHATFERHEATPGCRALAAQRRAGKPVGAPRCPVKGCKAKLVAGMAMRCSACKEQHCIMHRDPTLHACGRAKAAAAAAAAAKNPSMLGRLAASVAGGRSPKAGGSAPAMNPAQMVKDTAARRKKEPGSSSGGGGGGGGDASPRSCSVM
jgi:hypothetical protein